MRWRRSSTSTIRTSSSSSRTSWKRARWWARRTPNSIRPSPRTVPTRDRAPAIRMRCAAILSGAPLGLDVSWEPDLWGKVRNAVHAAQYNAQLSAADLENVRLSEQASLAMLFFQIRGQDALQRLYNDTIVEDKKALDYNRAQYETGITDQISVVEATNTLQNAQATATNIGVARAQFEHAIAVLVGKVASNFSIPVKAPERHAAADPSRPAVATAGAPARRRRFRACHGCGKCADRDCLRGLLSQRHIGRQRGAEELHIRPFVRCQQPHLVDGAFHIRDGLRCGPAPRHGASDMSRPTMPRWLATARMSSRHSSKWRIPSRRCAFYRNN